MGVLALQISAVESAERGGVEAEDHGRQNAQDHVDHGNGERYREGTEKGEKQNQISEQCARNVSRNTVIGFEQEATEVSAVIGGLHFVLVKAREASPFGNVLLPGIDLDAAIKIDLALSNGKQARLGQKPTLGHSSCDECHQAVDQDDCRNTEHGKEQMRAECGQRISRVYDDIEKRDQQRCR